MSTHQTLLMLEMEYSRLFGQYHAWWYPGSLSHQGISRHGTDSIVKNILRVKDTSFIIFKQLTDIWALEDSSFSVENVGRIFHGLYESP